jgi:hypothetical protein
MLSENLKEEYHLGHLDVDGKVILKYTLKAIWHEELFFSWLFNDAVSIETTQGRMVRWIMDME